MHSMGTETSRFLGYLSTVRACMYTAHPIWERRRRRDLTGKHSLARPSVGACP